MLSLVSLRRLYVRCLNTKTDITGSFAEANINTRTRSHMVHLGFCGGSNSCRTIIGATPSGRFRANSWYPPIVYLLIKFAGKNCSSNHGRYPTKSTAIKKDVAVELLQILEFKPWHCWESRAARHNFKIELYTSGRILRYMSA